MNDDYFFSLQANYMIKEKTLANTIFLNVSQLKNDLLVKLNSTFGDDCYVVVWGGAKYVKIVCKYKGCVFQHWFNF